MRLVVFLAVLALTACQTPYLPRTVSYSCADGARLRVMFEAASARVEQEGYAPLDLSVRRSASGYWYAAEGAELRGKDDWARWRREGAQTVSCVEAR